MSNDYYFHFRTHRSDGAINEKGGITYCAVQEGENKFLIGMARCSKKDNYSRKRGRMIALGRALKPDADFLKLSDPSNKNLQEVFLQRGRFAMNVHFGE